MLKLAFGFRWPLGQCQLWMSIPSFLEDTTMLRIHLAAALSLCALTATANDNTAPLIVNAESGAQSASWFEGKTRYIKRMEVTIGNLGPAPITLSGGCVRGYDTTEKAYVTDTIQEDLLPATLAPGATAKGFATFTAPDPSVYGVSSVRYQHECN